MEEGTAKAEAKGDEATIAADTAAITEDDNDDDEPADRSACYKKSAVGLVLLALIIYVSVDSATDQHVRGAILDFLTWIENNTFLGVLGFVAVYFFATICFFPGSILTLGAGFVFSASFDGNLLQGVLLGTTAVWVGASLGAIASFLLGRYLFRDGCVGKLTQKYTIFQALDNALEQKGLWIMILLRLSPIVPFNVLNYVMGVTNVQFWHYCVACVAMLPGTILYVFLGASAGSLSEIGGGGDDVEEEAESNKVLTITVIVVGIVFGFLAIGVTSYYAKQELNKVLEEREENDEEGDADGNDEEAAKDDEISA